MSSLFTLDDINQIITLKPEFDQEKLQILLESSTGFVENYIKSNSTIDWNLQRLSAYQRQEFKKAVVLQAEYEYLNGQTSQYSGEGLNGSYIPFDEHQKRFISPAAQRVLARAGFLYRGLR